MLWLDDYGVTDGAAAAATCPIELPDYSRTACPPAAAAPAPTPSSSVPAAATLSALIGATLLGLLWPQ